MSRVRITCAIVALFVVGIDLDLARAQPVDSPTKLSLDTSKESIDRLSQASPSKWQQGMEILSRVEDALRFGKGRLINSALIARNIIVDRAEDFASQAQNNVASVIAAKGDIIAQGSEAINNIVSSAPFEKFLTPNTRETVRLESETAQGILEKPLPNPIGRFLESYLRPTPLVDKIREEDKYGNNGDKFIGIGRALVGGFEGLSNFLNAVVDFPVDAAKKTSRGVSQVLNQLGGRLVGLQ